MMRSDNCQHMGVQYLGVGKHGNVMAASPLLWLTPSVPASEGSSVGVPGLGLARLGPSAATGLGQTSHSQFCCFGAASSCPFSAKRPQNHLGFGLLYLCYRESPAAVET